MISIIIPTLNEARRLPGLLARLQAESVEKEILVVDGGSEDATVAVAAQAGVAVFKTAAGRGQQLAHGAAQASGDILLFLHADSGFPRRGLAKIGTLLQAESDLLGGNFRVEFDGDSAFATWLTGFYGWFRGHGLYYGDSAIFVRRSVYQHLGGIRPIEVMEDYDFVRRLEAAGRTCCIAEPALITSSRRFAGRHPVAIFIGWLWMHGLFALGLSPRWLAALYGSRRQRRYHRTPARQEIAQS